MGKRYFSWSPENGKKVKVYDGEWKGRERSK
jgi:hypothetical protein